MNTIDPQEIRHALGVAADWAEEGLAPVTEAEIAVLAMSVLAARNPELYAAASTDDEMDDVEQEIAAAVWDALGVQPDLSWYFEGAAEGSD
ncbi:hypothetical protein [Micromonospora avicenniae]|uniref:Uncharacterized protein n=1 Tax=Micromonospora avicenniae TaxID=1198245 RepID=A0A1N6YEX3_9ACTN|nr:hypothetical protein [Micromonospora avicenniae]SIR13172.1 hypothetical protein SAMN05444858_106281 [Micromonospora avicenniae]